MFVLRSNDACVMTMPSESKQVPRFSPAFALPHEAVRLAHSRIGLGRRSVASRWGAVMIDAANY